MFCLACNKKYSGASQNCKTRPRALFTHTHFVQCWPQGTEACQIVGGKERHTEALHRMCRSHQGKQISPHYLGRGNKHPAGCKVSSRALADVMCAAVGPHGCTPGGPRALVPLSTPTGIWNR